MTNHPNRNRIVLRALDDVSLPAALRTLWQLSQPRPQALGLTPLAYVMGDVLPSGLLCRTRIGNLVHWDRSAVRAVDPRKAEAALAALAL